MVNRKAVYLWEVCCLFCRKKLKKIDKVKRGKESVHILPTSDKNSVILYAGNVLRGAK